MEYFLIMLLQILGVMFQVGVKVKELDNKFVDDSLKDVFLEFWRSDRITLIISGLIVLTHIVVHYIIEEYTDLTFDYDYYQLANFGIAFVLGYGGQKIVYKYLGKAESVLLRKADNIDKL